MKNKIARQFFSLAYCLFLLSASVFGEGEVKMVRRNVQTPDGVNLICEERGKGDTTLLFVHGWCGDRQYWKYQVDAFAADYRVITLDQAGHGESGANRKQWSVSGLGADLESVVTELGLKRVILVGQSMGGPVSLAAARRMPGTVVAVIGVDTLQNAESTLPEEIKQQFFMDLERDFKGTMVNWFPGLMREQTEPALKGWLVGRAASQNPKMAVPLMRELLNLNLKTYLNEAKVPVRCINSSGGFPYAQPTAVAVNKKYADFEAVIMDEVGHFPMLEKPEEFNQRLRDVLKEFAIKR